MRPLRRSSEGNWTQLPGPSVGAPEQVIAALEDGNLIFLIPHIHSQGEVEGSREDSALVLEMRSQVRQSPGLWSRGHHAGRWARTHHPQGCDGLLVVLEGCQLQALDGEEHQLRPRHQQDHLGAVALHEVRRHHGVWQEETCNLLHFLK